LYDTERAQLADIYADNARFSLTTTIDATSTNNNSSNNSSTATTSRRSSSRGSRQASPGAPYANIARRLGTQSGTGGGGGGGSAVDNNDRLMSGRIDVLHCLAHLPATRHDVDNAIIEAFEIGPGLALLSIHLFIVCVCVCVSMLLFQTRNL
jgi:hypothetical protein